MNESIGSVHSSVGTPREFELGREVCDSLDVSNIDVSFEEHSKLPGRADAEEGQFDISLGSNGECRQDDFDKMLIPSSVGASSYGESVPKRPTPHDADWPVRKESRASASDDTLVARTPVSVGKIDSQPQEKRALDTGSRTRLSIIDKDPNISPIVKTSEIRLSANDSLTSSDRNIATENINVVTSQQSSLNNFSKSQDASNSLKQKLEKEPFFTQTNDLQRVPRSVYNIYILVMLLVRFKPKKRIKI